VDYYDKVAAINGDPDSIKLLDEYNIKGCSRIVLLSSTSDTEEKMVDARLLLRANKLERHLKDQYCKVFDHENNKFCIYDLHDGDSLTLLPAVPGYNPNQKEKASLCEKLRCKHGETADVDDPLMFQPRRVNGSLLVTNSIAAIFGCSYYNRGVMQIFQEFVDPGLKHLLVPWRVRLPLTINGECYSYLRLFKALVMGVSDNGTFVYALPLGLFRAPPKEDAPDVPLGFVFTNPPKETIIAQGDCAYVIAPPEFGDILDENLGLSERFFNNELGSPSRNLQSKELDEPDNSDEEEAESHLTDVGVAADQKIGSLGKVKDNSTELVVSRLV